jgi:recombination protein RecA
VRLDVRRISAIKEGDVVTGNHVRAKVVKNKVAAPFREAEFDIMFDGGISTEGDILDLANADQIVDKSGAWFSYKGTRLGQGRENVKQFLRDNPDLLAEIKKAVIAKRMPGTQDDTKSGGSEVGKPTGKTAGKSGGKRKRA